ncbi:hypothetical protein GGU10DRAFT_45849 [Lentinula aff. detonsa]|uniref:Secreted protein n=1 Tax=Lentinula aff. detonsa TaxID=2804958 RepID=A0AA38L3K4_9AGAR|nr:hypothetical protein GGU10DRAFT_45849 [Lentinula aff. detonsa]
MRLHLACLALLGLAPFMHAMPAGPNSGALMRVHGPPSNQKVNSQGSVPVTVTVKFPPPFDGERFASPASSIESERVRKGMSRLIAILKGLYRDHGELDQGVDFQYVNEFRETQDPSLSKFFKVVISGPFYPCPDISPCHFQVPYDPRKIPKMVTA